MCCGTRTTAISTSWTLTPRRLGRLTADWTIRGGLIVSHGTHSLGCATRSNARWGQRPAKLLPPYWGERLCLDESLRLQFVTAHRELTQLQRTGIAGQRLYAGEAAEQTVKQLQKHPVRQHQNARAGKVLHQKAAECFCSCPELLEWLGTLWIYCVQVPADLHE